MLCTNKECEFYEVCPQYKKDLECHLSKDIWLNVTKPDEKIKKIGINEK